MLIAAAAVGLIAAYYFGMRPGMVAAGTTAALFLLAMVIPGLAIYAYGAVAAGVFGLLWAGPRMRRKGSPSQLAFVAKLGLARAKRAARDLGLIKDSSGAARRRAPRR
jgi:hypothetical protein